MFIDDAVEGISRVLESDKVDVIVDFCKGEPLAIDDLVKTAAKTFGKEDVVINHIGVAEEYTNFTVSPEGFEKLFNFRPRTKLETGFKILAKFLEDEEVGKRK